MVYLERSQTDNGIKMMLDTLNHDDQDSKPNGVECYILGTQAPTTPELQNEAVQEKLEFSINEDMWDR